MDAILLRKLTYKSKIGFGRYATLTVEYLMSHDKKTYLKWVYCNVAGIDFTDDVLEELHIHPDDRINKPGRNPELFDVLIMRVNYAIKQQSPKKYFAFKEQLKKGRRRNLAEKAMMNHVSKAILQSKNHGHRQN